jgi:signal transduction histidine kinase
LPAFLAVTLVPACGLAWLGWVLLQQDRELEAQRRRERREVALDRRLSTLERQLAGRASLASLVQGSGAVAVEFGPRGVDAYPPERLAWYPWLPETPPPPDHLFRAGEELEFRRADFSKAESYYRQAMRSGDAAIRAGALVRIARVLRKSGQADAALGVFDQMSRMDDVTLDGTPASLVARRSRCALLAELKRAETLASESKVLCTDLRRGRWRLTNATYQIHVQDACEWAGAGRPPGVGGELLAAAVAALWENWRVQSLESPTGRMAHTAPEGRVTVVWAQHPPGLRAVAASDACLAAPSGTGDSGEFSGRRRLLLAGLALILVLVVAGCYFIARSVAREMAAVRLQSEFVSAVSHEFRTPLTSLRQFTEILADKRVPEERRESCYQALTRATQRLHRLVEGLLDFGRMEAGASVYRFAPMDAAGLVRSVVNEFQGEVAGRGYTVELRIDGGGTVSADAEAITRALWNLLDNAVKYSPVNHTVWVDVTGNGDSVAIRVRDRGLGIGEKEQAAVFGKFVRGSASTQVEAKGTGIGLAMVDHIVRAHGGRIALESRPGEGSTFTILLPRRNQ